jgi:hypothetical protein
VCTVYFRQLCRSDSWQGRKLSAFATLWQWTCFLTRVLNTGTRWKIPYVFISCCLAIGVDGPEGGNHKKKLCVLTPDLRTMAVAQQASLKHTNLH